MICKEIKSRRANQLLDKEHLTIEEQQELLELLKKEEPSEKRDSYIYITETILKGQLEDKKTDNPKRISELIDELNNLKLRDGNYILPSDLLHSIINTLKAVEKRESGEIEQ